MEKNERSLFVRRLPTDFPHDQEGPESCPRRSRRQKGPTMFVELDTRNDHCFTVSLEWDRDTGRTQIVVHDARAATDTVFGVPALNAADAFRHPFRYAP